MPEAVPSERSNYRLTLSYDGRAFYGWQRHKEHPTVQGTLEAAITEVLGERAAVRGSGRTDRGTHALAQVANIRLVADVDVATVVERLNAEMPDTVRVHEFVRAEEEFDACDSAIEKQYRYVIWNHEDLPPERDGRVWHVPGELNVEAMREACPHLLGEHDFASFAKRPNFEQKSTTRTVSFVSLREEDECIVFEIRANGFLYKMVRNIVRALAKVGEGRNTPADFLRVLQAKDRNAAPGTAPASGLYLDQVFYAESEGSKS